MNNYICVNNQKIALTEGQIAQIMAAQAAGSVKLADVAEGNTIRIGDHELVVLEQLDGQTALILKDLYCDETAFSKDDNNYNGSYVDDKCQEFAQKLAEVVGWDNIVLHEVDLTSDDGLKDYGKIERRASSLTAMMYRKFVETLDKFNPGKWWWLATAHSTERHGNDRWAKCVSPSGYVSNDGCGNDFGVRPFCILKSNILVSK